VSDSGSRYADRSATQLARLTIKAIDSRLCSIEHDQHALGAPATHARQFACFLDRPVPLAEPRWSPRQTHRRCPRPSLRCTQAIGCCSASACWSAGQFCAAARTMHIGAPGVTEDRKDASALGNRRLKHCSAACRALAKSRLPSGAPQNATLLGRASCCSTELEHTRVVGLAHALWRHSIERQSDCAAAHFCGCVETLAVIIRCQQQPGSGIPGMLLRIRLDAVRCRWQRAICDRGRCTAITSGALTSSRRLPDVLRCGLWRLLPRQGVDGWSQQLLSRPSRQRRRFQIEHIPPGRASACCLPDLVCGGDIGLVWI